MEKFLNQVKKIWAKFVMSLRIFGVLSKEFCTKAGKIIWSYPVRTTLAVLLTIILGAEIYGAVMIYGYKTESSDIRLMAKIIPFPAAIVNYQVVTYNDYLHERDYIHHFYNATKQETINLDEVDVQIFSQLKEGKIIQQESLLNKVSISNDEINLTISGLAEKNGGMPKVVQTLDDLYGLNLDQFKKLIKSQLLRDKLSEKVIAKVKASHILIRVASDATADQKAQAKTKIDGIKTEITNGLDLAEAAKKYSEDTGSAEQGGSLDPFAKGEMVQEFSDAAFSTPVGQVTEPIFTDYGWHIIKIESKTGTVESSFADWIEGINKKSLIANLI